MIFKKVEKSALWLAVITVIFVISWVISFYYIKQKVNKDFRNEISWVSEIALAAINPERVANLASILPGDISQSPDFKRLKEQAVKLGSVLLPRGIDSIYALVEVGGQTFFVVESTPLGDPFYVEPGALYEEPPKEVASVFKNQVQVMADKYSDEYGTYISEFSPIKNFSDGKFVGVLGVDVDYNYLSQQLSMASKITFAILFFLYVMTILIFLYFKNRAEIQLNIKRNEEKIATILNMISEGIVVTDEAGVIVLWNNACQAMFGHEAKEVIGKKFDKFVSYSSVIDTSNGQLIKDFSLSKMSNFLNQMFEIKMNDFKKKDVVLELIISTANLRDKTLIISSFKDITERKKREEELKNSKEELENINKFMVGRELRMVELKNEIKLIEAEAAKLREDCGKKK